jgi:hypothetical protein
LPFKIFKIKKPSAKLKISNLNNYSTICCQNGKELQYPESKGEKGTHLEQFHIKVHFFF